jgi:prophage regulatory protein
MSVSSEAWVRDKHVLVHASVNQPGEALMPHELLALIGRIAELHGRSSEISTRIHQDVQMSAALHREISEAVANVWAILTRPDPTLTPPASPALRILRIPEVSQRVGLARSSVWRMVKEGQFPAPRRLSQRAVGWPEGEVDAWLISREALNSKMPLGRGGRRRSSRV